MKQENSKKAVKSLLLIFASFAFSACTHIFNISVDPVTEYPKGIKIDLTVELRVSQEFRDAKFIRSGGGDAWVVPIGESLSNNVEGVAKRLFSKVFITKGASDVQRNKVDVILTPKIVVATQTLRLKDIEQISTVMLEWRLHDYNGNLIWVKTIRGDGKGKGLYSDEGLKNRLEILNKGLFLKTFDAISNSPEIEDFVSSYSK